MDRFHCHIAGSATDSPQPISAHRLYEVSICGKDLKGMLTNRQKKH